MEAEFKGRIIWVLQERVGSELHHEAISAQSEGKGENPALVVQSKQWEMSASSSRPWIWMGKGGAERREGCKFPEAAE